MIELLAAIASDPSAIPLWGVALLAAGMYPIGFMLGGGCSPCCTCAACPATEDGTKSALPDTITVTLDGFTDVSQGPYLCNLDFSACYGSGADGVVVAPGGDPDDDKGPISKVALTGGGSGYAKLGREQPTLTVTGSGTGATFTASLAQEQDACGLSYWRVSSISVSGTGTGYADQEWLVISPAEGDTTELPAAAKINSSRSEPTLTAAVTASSPGTGCTLSASVTQNPFTPETWSVTGVSVTAGGTGYSEGDLVEFEIATGDIELSAASARVQVARTTPAVSLSLFRISGAGSGSGGDISATLTQTTSIITGRDIWEITAITINSAGTGYQVDDVVIVTVTDGEADVTAFFYATVSSVGGSGELVAFTISSPGGYYKNTDVVDAVEIEAAGEYYHDDGVVGSVTLTEGGRYYRENPELPASVATVTVSVVQSLPSAGAGAAISATVDDDPDSETFGQITGLTIDDAGDDYLAWVWTTNDCCGYRINGKPIVLTKAAHSNVAGPATYPVVDGVYDRKCVYAHRICGGWQSPFVHGYADQPNINTMTILVALRDDGTSAVASVQVDPTGENYVGTTECFALWQSAPDAISSCDNFAWSATNVAGRSISVSPGGEYNAESLYNDGPSSCTSCCQGEYEVPGEVEVEVEDVWGGLRPAGVPASVSGTYVLSRGLSSHRWIGGANGLAIEAEINPRWPWDWLCGDCIKTCRVAALAGFPVGGILYWDSDYACHPTLGGAGCPDNHGCDSTPICSPSGYSFSIKYVSTALQPWQIPAASQPAFNLTFL